MTQQTVSHLPKSCVLSDDGRIPVEMYRRKIYGTMETALFTGDRVWWENKENQIVEGTILERSKRTKKQSFTTYKVMEDKETKRLKHHEMDQKFRFYKMPINVLFKSKKSNTEEEKSLIEIVRNLIQKKKEHVHTNKIKVQNRQIDSKLKIKSGCFKIGDEVEWHGQNSLQKGIIRGIKIVNLKVETKTGVWLVKACAVNVCK